ncbi:MAG TPA: hypothetical protein VMV49_14125, partial [Candidatus Deferrimicrobium sp.]|nr:hypothetical protein [Candidatus Deferrimicrobium sp.]
MKTINKMLGISLICCILFGLTLFSLDMTQIRPTATNLAPKQRDSGLKVAELHTAIVIAGNDDFNDTAYSEGWPGNGTASSPYIISDYL